MRRFLIVTALAGLSACGSGEADTPALVEVSDAVCRPAAPGRDVTGCYATLSASRDDRLVSITSPVARELQIHEMKTEGGMMRMAERPDGLPLPAGETVRLAPGGDHIMLFGATGPLTEGGEVQATLTFEAAPPQTVRFRIGQPAAG